jgi:hypothetical protein
MSNMYMHGSGSTVLDVFDRVFISTRPGRVLPSLFYVVATPFLPPRLGATRQILPISGIPGRAFDKNQWLDRYISMA